MAVITNLCCRIPYHPHPGWHWLQQSHRYANNCKENTQVPLSGHDCKWYGVCAELFPVPSLGCKLCFFHRAALEEQLLRKLLSCTFSSYGTQWACFKFRRRRESLKMYSHMENSIDGFSFVLPLVYMVLWEETGATWLLHQLWMWLSPTWNIWAYRSKDCLQEFLKSLKKHAAS